MFGFVRLVRASASPPVLLRGFAEFAEGQVGDCDRLGLAWIAVARSIERHCRRISSNNGSASKPPRKYIWPSSCSYAIVES